MRAVLLCTGLPLRDSAISPATAGRWTPMMDVCTVPTSTRLETTAGMARAPGTTVRCIAVDVPVVVFTPLVEANVNKSENAAHSDRTEIVELEDEWARAIVSNDPERFKVFTTDDWVIVSDSGVTTRLQGQIASGRRVDH